MEELNERLRKINLSLRQQVRPLRTVGSSDRLGVKPCPTPTMLLPACTGIPLVQDIRSPHSHAHARACSPLRQIEVHTVHTQARVSTMYAPGLTYAPRVTDPGQLALNKAAETASSFLDNRDFSWPPPVRTHALPGAAPARRRRQLQLGADDRCLLSRCP